MYQPHSEDYIAAFQRKKIVFYAVGLKIYGQLPHKINRLVGGAFRSNQTATMRFPTGERNYTMVRFDLSAEAAEALWAWLHADAGFQWAVAQEAFYASAHYLYGNNAYKHPPAFCWKHASRIQRSSFIKIMQGNQKELFALKGEI
jgi:hypothetical protein